MIAKMRRAAESKEEAAYRRGDLFEKRRLVMDAWQAFADSKPMLMVLPLNR